MRVKNIFLYAVCLGLVCGVFAPGSSEDATLLASPWTFSKYTLNINYNNAIKLPAEPAESVKELITWLMNSRQDLMSFNQLAELKEMGFDLPCAEYYAQFLRINLREEIMVGLIPRCVMSFYSMAGDLVLTVCLQEGIFNAFTQALTPGIKLDSRHLSLIHDSSIHEKLQEKYPTQLVFSVTFLAQPTQFSCDLGLVACTPGVDVEKTEDVLKVLIMNHQAPYPGFMIYLIQPSGLIVGESYPKNLYELLACLHGAAQSTSQNVLFFPLLDPKEGKDFLRNFRDLRPGIIMHSLNQKEFLNFFMDNQYASDCSKLHASFTGSSFLFGDIKNPQAIPNHIFSELFPACHPFDGKALLQILPRKLSQIKALEVGQETRIEQYVNMIVDLPDSKIVSVRRTPKSYKVLKDGVVLCGFNHCF